MQHKEILTVAVRIGSPPSRGQFRFVQSVVRQVAYATQSRRDRKSRHLAAADHLASLPDADGDLAAVTSRHLLDAVDASSSDDTDGAELSTRACALLELAAARVGSLGSHAEAQRLLEQALARTIAEADLARLHLSAGLAASAAGDYRASVEHSARAVATYDALGRPIDAGRAAGIQAYTLSSLAETATAIEVAAPRWDALDGVPGSEAALLELAKGLFHAYVSRGEQDKFVPLADRRLLLAEATGDPRVIAETLASVSSRYSLIGATVTANALLEASAVLAREHDLPDTLAMALNNLASSSLGRDPAAAFTAALEGVEAAHRAGRALILDYLRLNIGIALVLTGRWSEAAEALDEAAVSVTVPDIRHALVSLRTRVADARGDDYPPIPVEDDGDSEYVLAVRGDLAVWHAVRAGDRATAARAAEDALAHVLAVGGIDEDFLFYWPPMVRAAIDAREVALAERLLEPVAGASPGAVSPFVRAEWFWLRGLVSALRGDPSATVEADLRDGIRALDDIGAVAMRAQAQEDLARWLVDQGREAEAERFVAAARTTYEQTGALGWLARLDAWRTTVVPA